MSYCVIELHSFLVGVILRDRIETNKPAFDWLDQGTFVQRYCWVVFAAALKNAVLENHVKALSKAFHYFDLGAIRAMDMINVSQLPIRDHRKANALLEGCRRIVLKGYGSFKTRLNQRGLDMLEELPAIEPANRRHLAKQIGLMDTAKPDVWLIRCASAYSATVDELVDCLCADFSLPKGEIE